MRRITNSANSIRRSTRSTNKYNAKKTMVDGILFDSVKESRRYQELKILEKAGEISDLQMQVEFELIPEQREPDTIGKRGGIKKGKVIDRKISYIADFTYNENGETVVEDVKGYRNPSTSAYGSYVIKRKLMLHIHGVRIREV